MEDSLALPAENMTLILTELELSEEILVELETETEVCTNWLIKDLIQQGETCAAAI